MRLTIQNIAYEYAFRYTEFRSRSMGVFLPVTSVLYGIVKLVWISAAVSLLATETIFGQNLPVPVPAWGALLILIISYTVLVSPLKAVRHASQTWLRQASLRWMAVYAADHLVRTAVIIAMTALAIQYFNELRTALYNIPHVAHLAASDISSWYNG
jgi:hypothetical protein